MQKLKLFCHDIQSSRRRANRLIGDHNRKTTYSSRQANPCPLQRLIRTSFIDDSSSIWQGIFTNDELWWKDDLLDFGRSPFESVDQRFGCPIRSRVDVEGDRGHGTNEVFCDVISLEAHD